MLPSRLNTKIGATAMTFREPIRERIIADVAWIILAAKG